jgi:predicted nucleic acid-binding protein
MIVVVADASILVGELLRQRGRDLSAHLDLRVVVAEQQWQEAENELQRRIEIMIGAHRLSAELGSELLRSALALAAAGVIEVVPTAVFSELEEIARSRIPRDTKHWPTVALAIALEAGILTADNDFLGCGCPTWTVDTLLHELDRRR